LKGEENTSGAISNMRWTTLLFMVLGAQLLSGFCAAMASSQSPIHLSSNSIGQGDLCLIRIRVEGGNTPVVLWMGKEVSLVANPRETDWYGYLVADLNAKPGHYKVLVRMPGSGTEKQLGLGIREKDYGVRRLTLPKNMVDLDSQTLQRVKKESRRMKGLWEAKPSPPLWSGPFIRPIPGKVVGAFGQRSIINDQPRSPHSGVDLKSERGAPIMAINRGLVVLTGDHFFTGLTVVIDHGGGILSMYFHLDRIDVQKGKKATKGHIIGLVGSTGRATGPHLHWGIRINGDRIDPLRLVALSQQLEE
jgi:murein DD-endopeptidase MepM/ murein hydrolase activator NlpD